MTDIVTQVATTDKPVWLVAALDELEFMAQQLELLRLGIVQPVTRLTPEQMAEIEAERPGEELSERPFLF